MQAVWQFLDGSDDPQGFWQDVNSHQEWPDSWCCPLTHYGFVSVSGPDSSTFLQGQTTCDWRQVSTRSASRGAYCNIKGRVQANFLAAMPADQQVLLRMPATLCEDFCQSLARYIVFSKAKMASANDQWAAIGVAGEEAKTVLEDIVDTSPEGHLASVTTAQVVVIQPDPQARRFECWVRAEALPELWQKLTARLAVQPGRAWEATNIAAGVADIGPELQDQYLPQMLNMQYTGGLSFKKGCYTGQEVIARAEYRGKLKKRLFALHTPAPLSPLPAPGDAVENSQGQRVGEVISAANAAECTRLLAVLTLDSVSQGALLLGPLLQGQSGTALSVDALPYTVDENQG